MRRNEEVHCNGAGEMPGREGEGSYDPNPEEPTIRYQCPYCEEIYDTEDEADDCRRDCIMEDAKPIIEVEE